MAGIYDDDADRILFGPHGSGTQGTWLSLAALTFALSGCAVWLTPDNAGSGFIGVSENQIKRDLLGETNRTISDPSVGLVAYMTGYDSYPGFLGPDRTYYAFSGIAPGYDTGVVVTGGTATYDAQYGYLVIDDIYDGWFGISGTRYSGYGSINLTADFDAGTLSGAASGLTVDGAISGSKLSGTVAILFDTGTTPESIKGVMTGYIGDTGTIGAFHANDDDTAAAGGFVGTVN